MLPESPLGNIPEPGECTRGEKEGRKTKRGRFKDLGNIEVIKSKE